MSRFTDSAEQSRIIHAPVNENVLVVAGAGSGKTYTMTRRITTLIEQGVSPERILGLTFTRKAASELLARVSAEVGASGGTSHPGVMFLKPEVMTYDAFFQSIVRQYGLLVGFDRDTQPLSDAGAISLATVVIDRHQDMLLTYDFGSFNAVVGKVLDLSHAIGNAMIGGDIATVDEAIERIRAWDQDFLRQLGEAIGTRPVPQDMPKPKAPKPGKKGKDAKYLAKLETYRADLENLCVWRCGALREVVRRREALLGLVEEYEQEKRRQNMAEFSDFTVAAYQLVSRFPSIAARYRRRYTHVLLDEYQDTSTTQAMLLAALFHADTASGTESETGEKTTADGAFAEPLSAVRQASSAMAGVSSCVSAVGDPFQSIYAWRGASPGAFRMFQQDFDMPTDTQPYPLSVTRRNPRIVLEAANNLTLPLRLPAKRASSSMMHEVDVAELSPVNDASTGTIGVLGFDTFGQEVDAVARFVRQAVRNYAFTDKDGKPADTQDMHPHVAVLFRGKTRMAAFAQGLEQAGLTTLVVGHSALLERPDMQDLMALLHAVADHTDAGAMMRLLATPRFGLGAEDLTALASLADRLDTQYRYRALIEAGLIEAEASDTAVDRRRQTDIVREYRDRVPHAVFLIDLLLRGDLDDLLGQDDAIDNKAAAAISRAGTMLRQVQAVANHPLNEVIETAVQALNLDIDMIVAQTIAQPDKPISMAAARSGVDSIISLVNTYTQEILEGQNPTLRGFIAWIDSLKQVEEEQTTVPDTPADVVLMTIHQAKGLEWDAVAVVGMAANAFPSSKSGLRISEDDDHPGGCSPTTGRWRPPEYHTGVSTWLDDESAVPVPVRVDAGILPRFPHDADPSASPSEALRMLDDVVVIDDEIYGDMRGADIGDGMDETDPDGWYLTQSEEYGRRLLADERRLAYVALTRSKSDALLTYSRYGEPGRDPRPLFERDGRKPTAVGPSLFWNEVRDSLCHHDDLVPVAPASPSATEPDGGEDASESSAGRRQAEATLAEATLDSIGAARPDGFFVGEHAAAYEREVVERAWSAPLEAHADAVALPWPASLSDETLARLRSGVGELEEALDKDRARRNMETGSGVNDELLAARGGTLLSRAAMLVADPDLMPHAYENDAELDERVRLQAAHLLAQSRQSVTALQTRAGHLGKKQMSGLWRGIIRPVPRVASPAAEAGTLFHAWAEQFTTAYDDGENAIDDASIGSQSDTAGDTVFATTPAPPSRDLMLEELAERETAMRNESGTSAKERHLAVWERRLADSTWARRSPAYAERQIVVSIPQLGGGIVNGKLDAVFHGGLDETDTTKRFTIVDWKTGSRPVRPDDIDTKLIQLDWYRLLLARIENLPLDSIDATLYYLSEPDEGRRELHARAKTEQEILAELSSGIPEQSDND
ncbi:MULTISPECIES: ATP-dependent DNA helicase [Bifidobacterium]|uniref:ATP-dependent DNA helicase n=1 Tax=Bifidobacterium TaxID=1678 RepID=UPI001BDD0025|nr:MULTISPECIES: ATP-dependent DNA helicase [Bifidobacterium]MBT1161531.1 ATP-dependent helicase [Bifidobacterium sp. SO1]MBW3078907.1 ATP-dependent helicase [Bifidobacterium simiiventris]